MKKLPSAVLVVVPRSCELPLGSVAVTCTGTPWMLVGFGCCIQMYSIQAVILSSDIAGMPAAGMPNAVSPGDWSVTVPFNKTGVPTGIAVSGAETVVADLPLPYA